MDYEKKYKEAFELMKDCIPDENGLVHVRPCEIFPELAESEDEKIRKVLVDYFTAYKEQKECGIKTFYGIPTDNIIAWLEKQGEQRSKLVDFDLNANDSDLQEETYFIPDGYHAEIIGDKVVIKKGEKKPWSEEDKSWFGEVWSCVSKEYPLANSFIFQWLKSLKDRVQPQSQWKPSKGQIEALEEASNEHWEPDGLDPLYTLLQDLKKLMEE